MQASLLIGLLFVAIIQCDCSSSRVKNLIRISLSKTTKADGGEFGQPITSYYVKTTIGTPGKDFRLLVDLNSGENWVPHYLKLGKILPRLNYQDGYAKRTSKTSQKENREYKINYDSCELTGKPYKDLIEFKDVIESYHEPKFSQSFLAISSASNSRFSDRGAVDGVISLNLWPLSKTNSGLMLTNLMRVGLIKEFKFGLALDDNQTLRSDAVNGGELTLGGFNPTYFLGTLRYHNVWSADEWLIRIQAVLLGAASVPCDETCSAMISTRHNDIYGPQTSVEQILISLGFGDTIRKDGFKADKIYECDCLKVASAPPLTFIIEGSYYKIPATSYIRMKVDGIFFKTQTCYVAILANMDSSNGKDKWILGTNFLTNFYSVFDITNRKVAFAPRA